MEQVNYYTPEIEDFFVGYEYELIPSIGFAILDFSGTTETHWATEFEKGSCFINDVDKFNGISAIIDGIKNDKCRTKYLDKEDIESEGFLIENSSLFVVNAIKHFDDFSIILKYSLEDKILFIKSSTAILSSFGGHCKSINEFRKILKWITI